MSNRCKHESLFFGSGAFYIFCHDCDACWVAKKIQESDTELDYDRGGDKVTGEVRIDPNNV